jgi:Domain of unknown function (DUF4327)
MIAIERYCITDLRDEVRGLIARGLLERQHRIYELKRFFTARQWLQVEHLLDDQDYLLRGHIIDLVGKESWEND